MPARRISLMKWILRRAIRWLQDNRNGLYTTSVSLLFHLAVVLVLAMFTIEPDLRDELFGLVVTRAAVQAFQ